MAKSRNGLLHGNESVGKSLLIVTEMFELGGVETYIGGEVKELIRKGWEVHLVCGRRFSQTLVPEGLTSLTTGVEIDSSASISEFIRAVDKLVVLAKEKRVTAVHAHPFTSMFPALAVASILRIPYFVTLHGPSSIVGTYGPMYDFMLGSLVLPSASKVIAVSDEIQSLAAPYVRSDRLLVQHNAVGAPPGGEGSPGSDRWLLVSRLDTAKIEGITQFTRMALLSGIPGIDICGSGSAQELLKTALESEINSGQVVLLGSSDNVTELMLDYAGVAGMGRVVLEGLVADRPVVLVGYDGIKGVITPMLYRQAVARNFSGRGLPSVDAEDLACQLRELHANRASRDELTRLVRTEHDPERIWSDFSEQLLACRAVQDDLVEEFVRQLRATHGDSDASAYWSREVMDVLGRVVASRLGADRDLHGPFSLHAIAYTREVVEQEAVKLRLGIDRPLLDSAVELKHAIEVLRAQVQTEIESVQKSVAKVSDLVYSQESNFIAGARTEIRAAVDEVLQGIKSVSELSEKSMGSNILDLASTIRSEFRTAFDEFKEESEINRDISIEAMESRIRADLADISSKIEVNSARDDDVNALRERISLLEDELRNVYASTSWVITRPMRMLKRLIGRPREIFGRAGVERLEEGKEVQGEEVMPQHRSLWRRAGNLVRRTASTGRLDPSDKARLVSMLRGNYAVAAQTLGIDGASLAPLLVTQSEHADVFVWAVIDWHFRMQRPQHLAAALARKGHRVFYISNNFVDSSTAGFAVESLDDSGRLFQVNLHVKGAPQIYSDVASQEQERAIRGSLAELMKWTKTWKSVSLVQHPYWIEPAQSLPNMQLVYDCMDHHGGFENNASPVLEGERRLVERSDLLIVTSQWLYDEMAENASNIALIRNATEYEHFSVKPKHFFSDAMSRKVIGYYGAIAEWFDVELVRRVALDHPDALVVLVGRDTVEAGKNLAELKNVKLVGEVPYSELPYWLHGFDVCLLPFQVIPLTLATNPVKVYEYLSAGKPVVSVDLPEMAQFEGLLALADTPEDFSRQVTRVLSGCSLSEGVLAIEARQAFAARQTWSHRAADLDAALEAIDEPVVSVVVLCYNNLEYTRACLDSLERYSDYPNLEIIAVDNASSDGTQDYLKEWSAAGLNRMYISNASNLGFSAGNNVGLAAARGDYLVVLNNDTYVTPGWVRGLVSHLRRNPQAGLVGPVTNNIGNEAKIEIEYSNMEEMIELSGRYTRQHAGVSFPIHTAAFFCVMLTRSAYESVGVMDEQFGVGFFEDDDYCRRLEQKGFSILCADDVFVHHHLSASFNKLKADVKQQLFEKNKIMYEAKWGAWKPHSYRKGNRAV